jgi:hypothetical protein
MSEQETKEQFNKEELEMLWFAVMMLNKEQLFGAADYQFKFMQKLQEKLDCMVEIKS